MIYYFQQGTDEKDIDDEKVIKNEKAINDQKRRINNLYRRQLSVPLFNMENTYAEYKQWLALENLEKDKLIEDGYNKALVKLQQIQVFEDRLVSIIPIQNMIIILYYVIEFNIFF